MPFTYADDPYLAYLRAAQMTQERNFAAQGLEGVNPDYLRGMKERLANEYSAGGPGAVDVNAPQMFPGLMQRGGGTGGGNQFSGLQDALNVLGKLKQASQLSGKVGGPDPYSSITDSIKDWLGISTPASEAAPIGMSVPATALPGSTTGALTTSAPEILQGAELAGYGAGTGLGAESAAAEAALAAEYGGAEAGAAGAGMGGAMAAAGPLAAGLGILGVLGGIFGVGPFASTANLEFKRGYGQAGRELGSQVSSGMSPKDMYESIGPGTSPFRNMQLSNYMLEQVLGDKAKNVEQGQYFGPSGTSDFWGQERLNVLGDLGPTITGQNRWPTEQELGDVLNKRYAEFTQPAGPGESR